MTGLLTLVMWSSFVPLSLPGSSVSPAGAVAAGVMVSRRGADADERLPTRSVCVVVSVCGPAESAASPVTDQVPSRPTIAVPMATPASSRVTLSPATPVPVIAGRVALVMSSPSTPLSLAFASVRADVGDGAVVLMISASGPDAGETLPAKSVSVLVRPCGPGARVVVCIAHVPSPVTVPVPTLVVPSYRVTTSPLTPVPVMTGVVTLVRLSPCSPLSLPDCSAGTDVSAGVVLSMVSSSGPAAAETLPAMSVCVVVSVCSPAASAAVPLTDQLPLTATSAVPMAMPPSSRVTVSPATPVPVIDGLVLLVMSSSSTPLSLAGASVGADVGAGAVSSIMSTSDPDAADTLPATSVSVPVRVCGPAARGLVVIDHTPSATVALPTAVLPSCSVTTSLFSPVPVMVGVVTLVMSSPARPLSLAGASVRTSGAEVEVLMATASDPEESETLPARSVSVPISRCAPSTRVLVVIDQAPSTTVALPTLALPSCSVTTSPLAPVPLMAGVPTLVMLSPLMPVSLADARARPAGGAAKVSMVSTSGDDTSETLPAASASVPVSVCVPTASVVLVIDHRPPLTMALPRVVLPSCSVTTSPSAPVPLTIGVVTLVMPSVCEMPVSLAIASVSPAGAGAVVSMTSVNGRDALETLPAISAWVVVSVCGPATSVAVLLTDHWPLSPTSAVPMATPPSSSVTVSPATPVPVMTGVVALVTWSPGTPLSLSADSARPEGAAGRAVSMVMTSGADATEVLPAMSVSVVVSVCEPAASAVLPATDHAPPGATVAVPMAAPPSSSVTVSPSTPVPVMDGVVTLVMKSPGAPLSLAGASVRPDVGGWIVVSMLMTSGADATETLPAMSVWVVVSVC